MSLTLSTMPDPGTRAPDFALPDVRTGKTVRLGDVAGREALLIVFMCAHCPYVKLVEAELAAIGRSYLDRPFGMVAISANDAQAYPADAPPALRTQAERLGFVFPYLYDETQETAKAYRAACTPDLFLYNRNLELVYRGQLDDARPGNGKPVTGNDLRTAIDCVLAGRPVPERQLPSTGCNIKWKPGSQPPYFG